MTWQIQRLNSGCETESQSDYANKLRRHVVAVMATKKCQRTRNTDCAVLTDMSDEVEIK